MKQTTPAYFFGRDGTIVNVLGRLRGLRASEAPRILVILGASGSGKSSLLRAGILPRLARDDRHFLPLNVIRPGPSAITGESGLLASLTTTFKAHGLARKRAVLREAVEGGAATLKPLLKELVQSARHDSDDASILPPTLVIASIRARNSICRRLPVRQKCFSTCCAISSQTTIPL